MKNEETLLDYAFIDNLPTRLPACLKIGGVEYIIVEIHGLQDQNGESVLGIADTTRATILIEANQIPALKWQCLFHELTHVACEHLGLPFENDSQINAIAYFILALLSDNGYLNVNEFPARETTR